MRRVKPLTAQRRIIHERSNGRCERCGHSLPAVWELHHRRLRSQGGDDSVTNLIALHTDCHNAGSPGSVHARPASARHEGFIVPSWADPNAVPIHLFRRSWALLNPAGGYTESEPPA